MNADRRPTKPVFQHPLSLPTLLIRILSEEFARNVGAAAAAAAATAAKLLQSCP